MQRAKVEQVQSSTYDLAIIGAGINGAAVAREAALRGLNVIVLDKGDFGAETSSWSSRLIHGGLRYLQHGEIPLVRESLRDREALFQIAGHLVMPIPFVVPIFKHNHLPGWMFRIGMVLYDALSLRKSVPLHRALGKKATRVEFPGLNSNGLRGALKYYDGQVAYAERLVLETLMSAAEAGADVMNYAAVLGVIVENGRAVGIRVHDEAKDANVIVRAQVVINAAGPWADFVTVDLGIERMIGGSKGTHMVVDPFPGAPDAAIYYEARSDNRIVLVIPWNGRYLIGTTDDRFSGDLDKVAGTPEELDYLLLETNSLIPGAHLTRESVLYTYSGVRPLPYRVSGSTGTISRSHQILEHSEVGGLISIVGGKLTPHLSLGTEVVDKAATLLERKLPSSHSRTRRLPGAPLGDWRQEADSLASALPWPASLTARLLKVYGTRVLDLVSLTSQDPALHRVIGEGSSAMLAAEIHLAVQDECAVHLTDILHRRAMVGLEPDLAIGMDAEVAEMTAPLLGWDAERIAQEVADHRSYVTRLQGGTAAMADSDSVYERSLTT